MASQICAWVYASTNNIWLVLNILWIYLVHLAYVRSLAIITLHQYVVQWTKQIGRKFGGSMESMNKIGINTILFTSLARALSRNMMSIKGLCLSRLLHTVSILIMGLTPNTTACRDKLWHIDENDASINTCWVDVRTSAPIKYPHYFTSITTNEINGVALHNVSTYIDTNCNWIQEQ